jgi:hypothetical protein
MEFILNLAWGLLAVYLLSVWWKLRGQKTAYSRCAWRMDARTQLLALCVILVILFPVISVSDDLITIQYPAEAASNIRKYHSVCCASLHTFAASASCEAATGFQLQEQQLSSVALPARSDHASANNPALFKIENRPPPAAL